MTDEAAVQRRLCEYFALRLGHIRDHEVGQPSTLLAIDIELEDIRAAWRHAVQSRDGDAVQAMAPPLARYFGIREPHGGGYRAAWPGGERMVR